MTDAAWDGIWGAQPPLLTALAALAFVVPWQMVGTALVAPVLRRSGLPRGWSLLVAWLLWLPLCGTLAQAVSLLGGCTAGLFRVLALAAVAGAVWAIWRKRHALAALRTELQLRYGGWSGPGWRAGILAAGAVQLLTCVFAAHPQRLYDQLNYHLVIAKRALAFGAPFQGVIDPHLIIAGPVEYAFVWPRALVGGDFFENGAAQCWVYLASMVPCLAAAIMSARRLSPRHWRWMALTAIAALPGILPNNEIAHIAKPGALLFAGAFLTFVAAFERPSLFPTLAVGLSLALVACNPTYIHVTAALGAVLLVDWWRQRRFPALSLGLVGIGMACLAVSVLRSYLITRTFFYPTDARFLATPFSDDITLGYWHRVAFGSGQTFPERWSGPLLVAIRSPGLGVWLGLAAAAACRLAYKKRLDMVPAWRRLILFLAVYAAAWPLFYDGHVYSRFVAGYVGVLLAVCFFATLAAPGRLGLALAVVGGVSGLLCSSADEMLRKLVEWNQTSLVAEYAIQFPRLLVDQGINKLATRDDMVLSDGPEKYFLATTVLSTAIAPQERSAWRDFIADPRGAARKYKMRAIIIEERWRGRSDDQGPYLGPVYQVFEALAPYGEVVKMGGDLVLKSECYFVARDCATAEEPRN